MEGTLCLFFSERSETGKEKKEVSTERKEGIEAHVNDIRGRYSSLLSGTHTRSPRESFDSSLRSSLAYVRAPGPTLS